MEKMRILAIDDNTVNLATLEQELKDKYEVVPMISGRRAIKYLYRERVDLILLDVQMPIMDGIETLKEIRTQENGITVPVIFLTAKKDKATVVEGSKLGIMDYITKPFDVEDLTNRIDRVFKRLGILPMEEEELSKRLKDILFDIQSNRMKQAVMKMDEVLGYQVSEDVSGRMRNAKTKLEALDVEAAANMVERVLRMIEVKISSGSNSTSVPISNSELNARLLYVLDDLENFKIKEALNKCRELEKFSILENIQLTVQQAVTKLNEFDDEEAERLIRTLVENMKKPAGLKTSEEAGGNGYLSSRLR